MFILIVGVVSYIGASNKQAMQMAELNQIEATYNNKETTAEDIYSEYDGGDIVPVYTPEQFAKVGSGEEVYVAETGKFYTFSTDKTYMFYGVPEDFNNVIAEVAVSAIAKEVSVIEGEDHSLSEYFSYTEKENDKITSVVYIDTCCANENVTNTKYLAEGTHQIKCIITKASGTEANAIKEIIVESSGLAKENTVIKPSASSNVQIVIPKGFAPAILESGTTSSSVYQSGKVISLMPKEQWSNITVEQINKGIVVVDHAITYDGGELAGTVPDFNEYVWIPIPDSSKFARTAWVGPYNNNGTWTNGTHQLATTSTSLKYWEDQTTTEYKNMVSSITSNKGFYISRYEASVEQGNSVNSKRGQMPKRYMSQVNAIIYSKNNYVQNTHLMYGIEWDSVLNWLIGNANIASTSTKIVEVEDIAIDSRNLGNYVNSTGNASRGAGDIKVTGWNEIWKVNNIYDLAGNLWELTQERYSTESYCSTRGGGFYSEGELFSMAFRNYTGEYEKGMYTRIPFQLLLVAIPNSSEVFD